MGGDNFQTKITSEIKEFAKGKQIDSRSIDELISSLRIVDDRVASFKYIAMKEALNAKDYKALLSILGFDPNRHRDFENCECSHGQCVAAIGHACDPVASRGRAKA